MHHPPINSALTAPEDLRRAEHSLEDVCERIARLSMSLGASLESLDDLEKILHRDLPFFSTHPVFSSARWPMSDEPRVAREWEELRGLLLLRCDLMLHLLKSHDLETALCVATEVETHMQHEGFKPGADGFNLVRYLNG